MGYAAIRIVPKWVTHSVPSIMKKMALMREMGVNAIRLAHYPQATYMYDLMDRHGIVTWAEFRLSVPEDMRIKVLSTSFPSVRMANSNSSN